ncbi:MAG TPA: molybdate ABC transporter substrate-binding protein [Pirellulales bacterium]|jgi:molybdenum ABC transporter molybdate-binding protein|nr:molybdate ABC transporter substrate-binding protein [Pirellulales bacterium]
MDDRKVWADDWSIRLRVWAERNGEALLGPGRLELLQAIDRWQSISAAARQLGMSYRHAWLLVQSINRAAGQPLVESAVGGRRGGGATLTDVGRGAMQLFGQLQNEVQSAAAQLLPRVLAASQQAGYVHLAAAISLEEVLGQLLSDLALRQPTLRVRAIYGASNELADHILAGAPCDLFVSADSLQLRRLEQAGNCSMKAQRGLARNGLAIVAPSEVAIALRRPKDLLSPVIGRVALADPESPLGKYTRDYLAKIGFDEFPPDRFVIADSSRGVLAALLAGDAHAGLVYTSDAAMSPGIRTVYRPRSEATVAEYRAVVPRGARSAKQAEALLDFLASPSATRKFRACGFLPWQTD